MNCFIRQEGCWPYEFCYRKRLRQIHLEDEKMVQEFVFGVYDAEATAAFNQKQPCLVFVFVFPSLFSLLYMYFSDYSKQRPYGRSSIVMFFPRITRKPKLRKKNLKLSR